MAPKKEDPIVVLDQKREDNERKRLEAKGRLKDCLELLFNEASFGGTMAQLGEEGFSGDAASLFVLVTIKNAEGEDASELIKIGWGEFSKKTFASGEYPFFKKFPFSIYCVRQGESYFADEALREEMDERPEKYLKEHSLFTAKSGEVVLADKIDLIEKRLNAEVKPENYDEMMAQTRNLIVEKYSSPDEFAAFLGELPDEWGKLGYWMMDVDRYPIFTRSELKTKDQKTKEETKKRDLMHILWKMGVNHVGIAMGDRKAMESVLALKKRFNFEKKVFV